MTTRRDEIRLALISAIGAGDKQVATKLANELAEADAPAVKATFVGGGAGTAVAWALGTHWEIFAAAPSDVKLIIGGLIVTVVGGLIGPIYRGVVNRLSKWEEPTIRRAS